MKSGEGTLIAFATGPGQTALDGQAGTNSPFTRALLAHITQPGAEIQQAMTKVRAQVNEETRKEQLPWGHTNLIGSVYLNPAAAPAARRPQRRRRARGGAGLGSRNRVLALGEGLQQAGRTERLPTNYPGGKFKLAGAGAHRRAAERRQHADPRADHGGVDPAIFTEGGSQLSEDQIGLDRNQRRDIQRRLTGLGFDNKATGAFDANTRNVIKRWQAARGYPESGYLNKHQHKALVGEILPARAVAAEEEERPRKRIPPPPPQYVGGGPPPGGSGPPPPNPLQVIQPMIGRTIFGR